MVTKIAPLSTGKWLSCGFALMGILLSAGIFGLATAEPTESKVSTPVRILLSDDTTDDTLSVRRKLADQRSLDKLYNNELRPTEGESEKPVAAELEPAPQAEIVGKVEEKPETQSPKSGLDSVLTTLTLPKFDLLGDIDTVFKSIEEELSSATESSSTHHSGNKHQFKRGLTNNNRTSEDHASSSLTEILSIETLLPNIELPKVTFFDDIESVFTGIGNDTSPVTTSPDSNDTSKYRYKMQNPGNFIPRYTKRATVAPVYMPTIGPLNGIQFSERMTADINSLLGTKTEKADDEAGSAPIIAPEKSQDVTGEKQSATPRNERRGIIALLGLDDLAIPSFNNPLAVGTGIKESNLGNEPEVAKAKSSAADQSDLEPDETISSELPNLNTQRPSVPGVKQIPTLAPKKIPDAPSPVDQQDKSASRRLPYKTLVNPDSFVPQHSVVPVSVRISDATSR